MGLRVFSINGKKATFNKVGYKYCLKQKKLREKITKTMLEEQLAERMGISQNTVHKWDSGDNGPIDYATVELLANALDVPVISLLQDIVEEGENEMVHLNDRQHAAVKRIYDICIWFLYEFDRTDGFNSYWHQFAEKGSKDPQEEIYELVEGMMDKVKLSLDQEYFDLRNCDVYNQLCEFVYEDLVNTYDGKLGYAYRFEAKASGNPTTAEDYDKAMIRLNTIIDKYE